MDDSYNALRPESSGKSEFASEKSAAVLDKKAMLVERVNECYEDFKVSFLVLDKSAMADMFDDFCEELYAVSFARDFFTIWGEFSDRELGFYLKYENPLLMVADAWLEKRAESLSFDLLEIQHVNDVITDKDSKFASNYRLIDDVLEKGEVLPSETVKDKDAEVAFLAKLKAAGDKAREAKGPERRKTKDNPVI